MQPVAERLVPRNRGRISNPTAVDWFADRLGFKDHDIEITFADVPG